MGYPRYLLVNSEAPGFYHCISRCVRRAFLCGNQFEHRRKWIEERLAELLESFAIRSCAYAIMANHLHLILKIDPVAAAAWSELEVIRRWLRLFPKPLERIRRSAKSKREAMELENMYVARLAADKTTVRILRGRLTDLGWFHKLLKEPIARRANEEDGCTGHFWEGRFKSFRLLDEGAILACMVYVDLNPFRAGEATTLSQSAFTSLVQRMKVLKADTGVKTATRTKGRRRLRPRRSLGEMLIPIDSLFQMTTAQYVSLVARTAGVPIDQVDHRDRLLSLGLDPDRWSTVLHENVRLVGSVVGDLMSRLAEARRRRARNVVNALDVFLSG